MTIMVKETTEIVARAMNLNLRFEFTGGVEGGRGWVGDVKYMLLDISKLKNTGWKPRLSSREAVERTTRELISELL